MSTEMTKEAAHKIVDTMPEKSTWDDLIHEIYVRQAIENGLSDSIAGRTENLAEVRKKHGLPE